MRITISSKLVLLFSFLVLSLIDLSYAAGGVESLSQATDIVDDVFKWIKGFVIAGAAVNFIWQMVLAIIGRGTWNDVFMALVYGIIAGAAAQIIQWAVQYFFTA